MIDEKKLFRFRLRPDFGWPPLGRIAFFNKASRLGRG